MCTDSSSASSDGLSQPLHHAADPVQAARHVSGACVRARAWVCMHAGRWGLRFNTAGAAACMRMREAPLQAHSNSQRERAGGRSGVVQ